MSLQRLRVLCLVALPVLAVTARGQEVLFSDNFESDSTSAPQTIQGWTWSGTSGTAPIIADGGVGQGNVLQFSTGTGGVNLVSDAIDLSSAVAAGDTITFTFDIETSSGSGLIMGIGTAAPTGSYYFEAPAAYGNSGLGSVTPLFAIIPTEGSYVQESYTLSGALLDNFASQGGVYSEAHIFMENWGVGSDPNVSLDNFMITATAVPEATDYALWSALALGTLVIAARVRRTLSANAPVAI